MSSEELSAVLSAALVEWFPDDLEASLSGELVQFAALVDTDVTSDGKLRALPLSQMLQMTTSTWSPPERQWSCACTD